MQDSQPHSAKPVLPQLGLSACLAGQSVRYDGSSNPANTHVAEMFSQFDIRTFCPEVGIGLSIPRPPIHLVGQIDTVRVLDVASHEKDYTADLVHFANHVLNSAPMLCGYILVTGSPSCGNQRVKRFSASGELIARDQQGMFAQALSKYDPLLPCADDEQLIQDNVRRAFLIRATTYHQWKLLRRRRQELTQINLSDFYQQYQSSLDAPSQKIHSKLQRIIDTFEATTHREITASRFITTLMNSLPRIHDVGH